jgi:O-antigen ligase
MKNLIINTNLFWQKYWIYFFYLFALTSAISISASTIILSLFLVFYLTNIKENLKYIPRDFKIFFFLYLWKAITLILNKFFSSVIPRFFNGIWDKLGYITASNLNIDAKKVEKFIKILIWVNTITVIYAILQKYLGFPIIFKSLFTQDMLRFKGFHSNPLRFAGYFSTVCIIAFSFASFYSKKLFYFIPFLFFGLMLNASRTYWFSTIISFLIISFLKNKKFMITTFLSISVFLLIFFSVFGNYRDRIEKTIESKNIISHMDLRKNLWKAGLEIFLKNPLYGIGDGKVSNYLKPYLEKGLIDNIAHCHNIYITLAAETGVIGLGILLWILIYFIKKYYNEFIKSEDNFSKAFSISLLGSFINIAIAGLTEHNFATFVIWGFLSFYMGIYESYKKSINLKH